MMITFGLFFLLFWSLHKLSNGNEKYLSSHPEWMKAESELKKYVFKAPLMGLLFNSWSRQILNLSILWRSQIWEKKQYLFFAIQTLLGQVVFLSILLLIFEVNSLFLVGAISFIYLALSGMGQLGKVKRDLQWLKNSLVYWGLAFLFLELSFKNSGLILQFLMETEIAFLLTIDSFWNCLLILGFSFLLSLIIPLAGFVSLCSFVLFVNSQLSFLGLGFMLLGDTLAQVFLLQIISKSWSLQYRKQFQGLIFSLLIANGLFILVMLGLKMTFNLSALFNQIQTLKWVWILTFLILAGLQYILAGIWGHFSSKEKVKDTMVSDLSLMEPGKVSMLLGVGDHLNIVTANREILVRRQSQLVELLGELSGSADAKKKVPEFVVEKFQQEKKILDFLIDAK